MPEIAEREAKEISVWPFRFSGAFRSAGLRFGRGQDRVVSRENAPRKVVLLKDEYRGASSRRRPALTKWFSSPRLETRTKESNMPASTGVIKPPCAVKVNAGGKPSRRHHRPTMSLRGRGLSVSVHVGTRKMVNYA